eukprot:TRINITY_DN15278_c0_g1_i1.p1 TRINITY_DN15278_c0_g1~~TRINITY_DN15278_c0_g1_i1.p1  ORF type:complete len:289 (+),score=56.80 TRINITY_DN15278_c0_g1_i1:37-903(+)
MMAPTFRHLSFIAMVLRTAFGNENFGSAEEGADAADVHQDVEEEEEEYITGEQLRHLHRLMDGDNDGHVSFDEPIRYAKNIGQLIAKTDAKLLFSHIDTSEDGKISLDEHLAHLMAASVDDIDEGTPENAELLMQEEKAKFVAADVDQDQLLDSQELAGLLSPETHDGVLTAVTQASMGRMDKNGDGRLHLHEFLGMDPTDGSMPADGQHSDFQLVDTNNDGHLSLEEVRAWESGEFFMDEAIKGMMDVADADRDKRLTADELANAVNEIHGSYAESFLLDWVQHHEL